MGYRSCRHGEHGECNGYIGVHDTYVCHCRCHGEWQPNGKRIAPGGFCTCRHVAEDHDLDDGCGACAMAMVGPCREFRPQL